MEILCLDYLSLRKSKGGIENVLVVTDHFSRYAQAFPTTNQTAKTTAKILFDKFIVHYGFPARIHSDVVDTRPPTVEPDSTVEDSDGGYDASISSCSQAGDDIALADASTSVSSRNGKYVVPAKRKPGMPGYKPHYTSSHVPSESSYSGRRRARPQRVRRKPQWMNPTVWDFSQPYTITVDRKDVAFL